MLNVWNIYQHLPKNHPNVGKYSIHGAYGTWRGNEEMWRVPLLSASISGRPARRSGAAASKSSKSSESSESSAAGRGTGPGTGTTWSGLGKPKKLEVITSGNDEFNPKMWIEALNRRVDLGKCRS